MAVDRGGLRYTIEVRDQFSKQLKAFRSEIAAIRKELGGLRTAQAQLNTARNSTNAAQASNDRAQLERLRRIQAGLKQQKELEDLRGRITRAQQRERTAEARQEIELFRRRKNEEAKAAAARANALRRERAQQRRANREVRQGSREFDRLTRSARRSEGAVNRVSFTFRRLFGIFAAFQAARAGADLFRGGILQGIQFNQTIEDSQISLAALFTAAGRVTNEMGELVTGAEAFALAQGEARRQTNLLRNDALGTTATFQELLRAFQAGVGPGLEAGLNLDEIREVTVRVSQAAAALTVPQNQLIEEIRSLLRGTIQARTTIVASVLGITNEDIRKAKETGNLFNFLRERLGPFAEAAEATRGSLTGLLARISDATAAVSGAAAGDLFDELKNALLDTFVALVDFDEESGKFIANAEAVAAIKPLFDALAQTIRDLKEAASGVNLSQITAATGAIGEAIRVIVNLGAGAIQGIIAGISDLANLFGGLSSQIGGLRLETITELLRLVLRIGTVVVGLNLTLGLMRTLFLGLVGPVIAVGRGIASLASSAASLAGTAKGALLGSFALVLGAVIAIGAALKQVIDDFAGFDVKAGTFLRIIAEGFQNLITIVQKSLNVSFTAITTGVLGLFAELSANIITRLANLVGAAADATSSLLPQTSADLRTVESGFRAAAANLTKTGAEASKKMTKAVNELGAAQQKFFDDINAAISDDESAASAGEIADAWVDQFIATINEGLDGLFDRILPDANEDDTPKEKGEEAGRAFVEGFNTGGKKAKDPLRTYLEGLVTNFENGMSIIRGVVQQTSSFIADSIVDALDPTTDTDLLDRFARFLQSIAKLIIQQLVQVAIAKAVLGLLNPSPSGLGTQLGQRAGGLAEGGEVPDGHDVPRIARPKGLDPRDTTPIFAQPGEFMMKLASVKRYGLEAMEALNRGLIDPVALNALLGKRSRRHISGLGGKRSPHGYVEGGIIQSATDGAVSANGTSTATAAPTPTPAVIVANDQTMEKMMAGGSQAFKNYLRDNAQEIDGILRQGRSGG